MKRLYRVICLVLTIVFTGYLFVHVSYMHRGYTRLMGFYGLKDNTIDVAFVGTSITFSSFMPMEAWNEYGMAAYDYCTNVQLENALRYSVREVMKTQSPKLIMIDVCPFIEQHSVNGVKDEAVKELWIKYNVDSMKYSVNRTQLIYEINRGTKGDIYSFFYYVFDISRYHTNLPSLKQYNNAYNDVNRGYGYLGRNGGAALDISTFAYDDGSEEAFEGYHEEYLEDLLSDIDELDCEVVFYCGPVIFIDSEGFHQYARKNYIKRIVEERGYTFWDLTTEVESIGLDYDKDFWCCDHFDSLGAEKVTKYLSKMIIEAYDIPDRRNDMRYASWNEDYQTWLIMKEEYNEQDKEE